jgi:hypothetical protein
MDRPRDEPRRALVALACLAVLGCGSSSEPPGAGDACSTEGQIICEIIDPMSSVQPLALECYAGSFRQLPCKGKGGCSTFAGKTTCDIASNDPGDACPYGDDGATQCSVDKSVVLQCLNGVMRIAEMCPGGCQGMGTIDCKQ